jgi:hypothetical protein
VSGALLATLPLTTIAFAWTQPICNPSTGEVLQPSHFADEAAYNKYLKDHPGSFEMQAGAQCAAPVSQHAQAAPAAAGPTTNTSSPPAPPPGTVVCVVNVTDVGTIVEQRHVPDVTRWLTSHPGSFTMAAGKDCGPTFTPNLPTTTNMQLTTTTTASAADTTASAPLTTAAAAGPLTASAPEQPTLAAASVDVAGVTVTAAVLGAETELASPAPTGPCAAQGDVLEIMTLEAGNPSACGGFGAAALDLPAVGVLDVAGEQVLSVPPFAGDGTTADDIVP